MAITVVELQPATGLTRSLDGGATIGRAEGCDVQLDDPMVSRRHAIVVGEGRGSGIEDLDSANGLYVNGQRCRETGPLHAGDIVSIGATIWMVASP